MQWSGFPTSTNIEDRRPTPSPFDLGMPTPGGPTPGGFSADNPNLVKNSAPGYAGAPIPVNPSKIDIDKTMTNMGMPGLPAPTPESLNIPTTPAPQTPGLPPGPQPPSPPQPPSLPPGPPPPPQAPRMPTPQQGPISPLPTPGGMTAASPVALPTISTGATPQKSSASSLDQPAAPAAPKPPQPVLPPAPPAMPAPQARRGGSLYAASLGMMASQPLDTVSRRIGML